MLSAVLNWEGIAIGLCTFLIIGVFHPFVIKGEYFFGQKISWVFALSGIVAGAFSIFCENTFVSTLLAVFAFSCFWSVKEVADQKKRVEKGWFPMNPKRAGEYQRGLTPEEENKSAAPEVE